MPFAGVVRRQGSLQPLGDERLGEPIVVVVDGQTGQFGERSSLEFGALLVARRRVVGEPIVVPGDASRRGEARIECGLFGDESVGEVEDGSHEPERMPVRAQGGREEEARKSLD